MTAKHRDETELPAPPCTVPLAEYERVKAHSQRIGELNGPWAILLKLTLALFIPGLLGWQGWMMTEVSGLRGKVAALETNAAVVARIVDQIRINTETLNRHSVEIAANAQAVIAMAKEIGTSEQRVRMYVTRGEWELRNETRDREMAENRTAHADIITRLDRLIERTSRTP